MKTAEVDTEKDFSNITGQEFSEFWYDNEDDLIDLLIDKLVDPDWLDNFLPNVYDKIFAPIIGDIAAKNKFKNPNVMVDSHYDLYVKQPLHTPSFDAILKKIAKISNLPLNKIFGVGTLGTTNLYVYYTDYIDNIIRDLPHMYVDSFDDAKFDDKTILIIFKERDITTAIEILPGNLREYLLDSITPGLLHSIFTYETEKGTRDLDSLLDRFTKYFFNEIKSNRSLFSLMPDFNEEFVRDYVETTKFIESKISAEDMAEWIVANNIEAR